MIEITIRIPDSPTVINQLAQMTHAALLIEDAEIFMHRVSVAPSIPTTVGDVVTPSSGEHPVVTDIETVPPVPRPNRRRT
jgi:hypothetical protein